MDALYILSNQSNENNEEIKYSLRSLEKFAKGVDRVFITGVCPNFIDKKKVIFLPCDDPYCRNMNHFYKVYDTFVATDISDNCILMYDDIFFCEKVDINKYPWFCNGELPKEPKNSYEKGLTKAREWLSERGMGTLNFATHTPCIYNRLLFCGLHSIFNDLREDVTGMSVRAIYGNQFADNFKRIKEDVKIRTNRMDLDGVVKQTRCFSTGDFTYNTAKQWLHDNFMWRSKWEK